MGEVEKEKKRKRKKNEVEISRKVEDRTIWRSNAEAPAEVQPVELYPGQSEGSTCKHNLGTTAARSYPGSSWRSLGVASPESLR